MPAFVTCYQSRVATGAGSQDVDCNPGRSGDPVDWSLVVGRCLGSACTRIELLFSLAGVEYYVVSSKPAADGVTVSSHPHVIMPANAQLIARFVGATVGDVLTVWGYGWAQGEVTAHTL